MIQAWQAGDKSGNDRHDGEFDQQNAIPANGQRGQQQQQPCISARPAHEIVHGLEPFPGRMCREGWVERLNPLPIAKSAIGEDKLQHYPGRRVNVNCGLVASRVLELCASERIEDRARVYFGCDGEWFPGVQHVLNLFARGPRAGTQGLDDACGYALGPGCGPRWVEIPVEPGFRAVEGLNRLDDPAFLSMDD